MSFFPSRNLKYNEEIPLPAGLIHGQSLGAVSGMKFGLSTVSYSGCEVIAVYNALLLSGRHLPFPVIARYMGDEFSGAGALSAAFRTACKGRPAPRKARACTGSGADLRRVLLDKAALCIRSPHGLCPYEAGWDCRHLQCLQQLRAYGRDAACGFSA